MIALSDYPSDTRVRREAEALVARGDSVDVICPWTPALGDARVLEGVRLHPVGTLQRTGALRAAEYLQRDIWFVLRAAVAVARLHRVNRYDVVQVHTMPDFLVFAAIVPKLTGSKVIIDVHDLVPELFATKFGVDESAWIARLTRFVERQSIRFADHALAVHRPHLEALLAHGNPRSKFSVIMNTPDPRLFERRASSDSSRPFTLIYHGTLSRRHGVDTAVRAIAVARRRADDIRFEIAGDGDDVEELVALVDELGLRGSVVVSVGRRPVAELKPMFDRASAGIVPLTNDGFTRHTLPVKLLEFIALGIPVISSRTDTIQAYVDDTMVSFFEPGDADELAERILELRDDPGRRRTLAANAAVVLERHSWERESARYRVLVDSVVGERDSAQGPSAASR